MSKQAAVEWLKEQYYESEGKLTRHDFEQAKQMEMQKSTIQGYNRKAIFAELTEFDYLAKPNDYIEVCEWHNGEGFDVEVSGNVMPDSRFQLTWGQYEAMKALIKELEGNNED